MPLGTPGPRHGEEFTAGRELVDVAELAALRERAEAAPDDLDAQWSAGVAHMWASLQGHVELRDTTERLLHRAWQLDPRGDQVPAAKVLARYLNMRSSVLDLSAIELQVALYEQLCDPDAQAEGAVDMPVEQFTSPAWAWPRRRSRATAKVASWPRSPVCARSSAASIVDCEPTPTRSTPTRWPATSS